MGLCILGSSLTFSAQGGRGKEKNQKPVAKNFASPSEDEERQVLSIEAQLTELREFAKQSNLFVVKEFYESKTAKEPGREVFNFMLSEIEKGTAQGILAWNPID